MQANIMKVKSCSEQFYVKSEKADNGQMAKRNLVGSLPVNTTVKFFKTS